jgi:type VI secretion system protein ImpG
MNDDILNYYERELTFTREMGAEFAKKYPKIAGRLLLEPDKCEDPHTERLIEAFALLSGRVHKKIDDAFPEITEALLNIIYPHYVNPLPSMSVVKFETVNTTPPSGYRVERQTPLYSKPVGGIPCRFTTGYPVTLWPIEVVSAGLRDPRKLMANAQQAVAITLKTYNDLMLSQLGWESIRFFLNGQSQHMFHLRELLFNNACMVECEWQDRQGKRHSLVLKPEDIRPVGFDAGEELIPHPPRSFPAYLLLFEYFAFPEKFLFFDLKGLERLRSTDVGDTVDIWIYFDRMAQSNLLVNADTFCLNATPVVNLFSCVAEPLSVEQRKTEYRVIPDIRRIEATEVFSIDKVVSSSAVYEGKEAVFEPFYSLRHHLGGEDEREERAFWCLQRRPSGRKGDDGTDVYLSFVDWGFASVDPDVDTVTVHTTCTNRDLPARLPFRDPGGDFDMEIAAPVARITCLMKPTPTRRPSLGGPLQWRLISHLSLNYMSLVEGGEEALKEILKLYDFDNSPSTRQQISGIVSLQSDYVTRRVGQSFCRGIQVTVEFDEDKYVGTGVYLLASVLERFFGQYVSVNSFSQMVAKTIRGKETLKKWPPRNGNRVLL